MLKKQEVLEYNDEATYENRHTVSPLKINDSNVKKVGYKDYKDQLAASSSTQVVDISDLPV